MDHGAEHKQADQRRARDLRPSKDSDVDSFDNLQFQWPAGSIDGLIFNGPHGFDDRRNNACRPNGALSVAITCREPDSVWPGERDAAGSQSDDAPWCDELGVDLCLRIRSKDARPQTSIG